MQDNPEIYARMQQSYFLYNGLAKVGHGLSALDDMTGNVVSGLFHKIGEGFEYLGTKVRRTMRDDMGFSQRIAQNAGDLAEIAAQVFAPAAVGSIAKSSFVAAGVTKFRSNVIGAFTRAREGVISGESIGLSWLGNWFDRGYAFENYLATLPEFAPHRLPPRFKTFDFFGKGKAISVKTLDTNTLSRIANPELVRHQINGYINKMLDFTGHREIRATDIVTKELHLAIPANTSAAHVQQIMHSVQYGIDNGIKVVITRVK
jgi:hypothetical protein